MNDCIADDTISRKEAVKYVESYIHEIITESGIDKNKHTNEVLRKIAKGIGSDLGMNSGHYKLDITGHCEDCKHFRKLPLRTDTVGKCIQHWGVCPSCDWYCADFEPQESEEENENV